MAVARIRWRDEPKASDYPAAENYLLLIYPRKEAAALVRHLRGEPISRFKAIDVLRASRELLLDVTNSHVKEDHQKILNGQKLSPPLLVRHPRNARMLIVDGYHRICAVCALDEDEIIPCKIVSARK
ncbi:MAG TPA: hypothetical protein VHE37_00195 [Nevskiaceae bacterium]|nr:hypothetical protein [Nevskiaceae bacterium]